MARVFVSYRRVAPDNGIAMALYRRLSERGHDVFLDSERVHLGDRWPRTIRDALDRAEWFVALVSPAYLNSTNCIDDELVIAARRLGDGGLAGLLPVRLAFDGEFPDSVRDVLARTQAFAWRGDAQTEAMIDDVLARLPRPTTLHGLVKEEEARQREEEAGRREAEARRRSRSARRVAQALGSLFAVAIASATVAVTMWRRADQARAAAVRQERRETASKLAAMAERSASPSGALALAAEAIDATGSDGVNSDVMRAAYAALAGTHGPALPGSQGDARGIAVSSDGALAAVADEGGVRVWTLAPPAARPRHLEEADDLDMVPVVFDRGNTYLVARTTHGLWSWDLREPAPRPVRLARIDEGTGMNMDDRVARSADGTWLFALSAPPDAAAGSTAVREVRAWNLAAHRFDPGAAPIAVPLASPDRIVSSPTAAWIAVEGQEGIASIELRSRAVRITSARQLGAAIAQRTGGREGKSIGLLAISDGGALIVRPDSRPRSVSIVTAAPGDLLRATLIGLPDAPNGGATWRVRRTHPSLLFIGVGTVRPSHSDTRICVLPFDGGETSIAAPDGEVTCNPIAGYPLVARNDWLATSEVLAGIVLDEAVEGGLPVAFQRGAIRDHGVPLYATLDLDAEGRTAVVWTPDAVVSWPSGDGVPDGRAWSGALPVEGPSRGDRSGSHPAPRCERVPSSDLVAASEDGRWEVVSRRDRPERGDRASRLELWSCDGSPHVPADLGEGGGAFARFDADARCLVVAVADHGIQLWSRGDGGWRLAASQPPAEVTAAAFSPDLQWLALGGRGHHVDGGFGVSLVPLTGGCGVPGRPQHLAGPHLANSVTAIVFRSDARQLAMVTTSGGETGGPVLATWDVDAFHTGGEPSLVDDGVAAGDELALAYRDDLLYALGRDGARHGVWPVTPSAIRDQARRHAGRNLSLAEWRAAFGDRPYRKTFPELAEPGERIEQVVEDARTAQAAGQRVNAAAGYQVAVARALDRDARLSLQRVCSCGVHDGWASVVAPACDRMFQLAPRLAWFVETYALAQAHAGQPRRALELLRELAGMQLAREFGDVEKARAWIAQLEHGELPELPPCPP